MHSMLISEVFRIESLVNSLLHVSGLSNKLEELFKMTFSSVSSQ